MNRFPFLLLLLCILGLAVWIGLVQRAVLREALRRPVAGVEARPVGEPGPPGPPGVPGTPRPSVERLRLQAEVTRLRAELDSLSPRARAIAHAEDDWAHVWGTIRPSEQPGFVFFTNLAPSGSATPDAAFASWQRAMRQQGVEPLTRTRMKEVWEVPEDFDAPDAYYSIDVGRGVGGEIGYRVVKQEPIDATQVQLLVEMENPDGSSFLQERILVLRDGRWRVKPSGVVRLPGPPSP